MAKGKTLARIIIKDGIKPRLKGRKKQLMDPVKEKEIKKKIETSIDTILKDTEYERVGENPPTIGVEKDTV